MRFINQNTSNILDKRVRDYVQEQIKFLKNAYNQTVDAGLYVEFLKALHERGLTIQINESKQHADMGVSDYVQSKRLAGKLSAKLSKALTG